MSDGEIPPRLSSIMTALFYPHAGEDMARAAELAEHARLLTERPEVLDSFARRTIEIALEWIPGIREITEDKDTHLDRVELRFLHRLERDQIGTIENTLMHVKYGFTIRFHRYVEDWQVRGFTAYDLEVLTKKFWGK